MEAFLRDNVDLQAISGKALAGDAHFFEDVTTPAKIKQYLDSFQVLGNILCFYNYFHLLVF
jgi:hypothetical protein